jgi:hypothetical protein
MSPGSELGCLSCTAAIAWRRVLGRYRVCVISSLQFTTVLSVVLLSAKICVSPLADLSRGYGSLPTATNIRVAIEAIYSQTSLVFPA